MSSFDVIVIGAGASGMMAASRAGERGKRVLLIEKNKVVGKKLSITGGGRCNITNAEYDTRELVSHYGDAAKYLHSPFSQFGVKDTFAFFEAHGLPLVIEARKRVFPESQNAEDVTRVLKESVNASRVTIKTGVRVEGFILKESKLVGVKTNAGDFFATSVILATGGASHAETGASGEGITWLYGLGHTTHEPNPDIVPLKVDEAWVKALSGTTLSFMKITFSDLNNSPKTRFSRTGKILFTHFGISGPLILNAAHEVKKILRHGYVRATIDMYPDTEIGTLRNRLLALFDENKNKELRNVLKDFVPAGMVEAVLAHIDPEIQKKRVHSVTQEERYGLVELVKGMPLTITGTMGYDWAVVSDGGIDLDEVDMRTMASKKFPNLFLTGDVLNISRPSGGYSLQLCWTTGYIAGSNV